MASIDQAEVTQKYIESDKIELGKELDPDSIVEFEVKWIGDENDIDFTFGSCSCTDTFFEDGKIKGTLNISKSNYDRETKVISQYAYVYLKDNHRFFIADDKKRRINNPSKEWFRIHLTGLVK